MVATYDPLLILLSVAIAIVGAYAGLRLAGRLAGLQGSLRKALLSAAAVTIGGGIWSMHFVGMLALSLPVTINYDVLLTLISALVSILVTGIGLFIASHGRPTARRLCAAGLFMGLGISSMHYIGMAAVRANCVIDYSAWLVAASVAIGIAAATLALWLAFNLKGTWQTLAAAVVMGLAIGMITPPVAINLYVASSITGERLETLSRNILPMLLLLLSVLFMTTYIPLLFY